MRGILLEKYHLWCVGREGRKSWYDQKGKKLFNGVKLQTSRRPRECVLVSKELLAGAGKVWEAGRSLWLNVCQAYQAFIAHGVT